MKILVIAKKFNDIYYSISLPEWRSSEYKSLLILSNKLKVENFPFTDLFDEVIYINCGSGKKAIIHTLLKLRKLNKVNFDTVVLSNISIVSNKYILSLNNCKQAILIEDGYMNYYYFKEPNKYPKKVIMRAFGINQNNIINKIKKTYLLQPELAKYFFGEKSKLNINTHYLSSTINNLPDLQGKKIFIGQPLYHSYTGNSITIDQYNHIINNIIERLDIDLYVPHAMADTRENINCTKLDLGIYRCTFEMLASIYDLEFYSFSSTVLYSTKVINPKCLSVMIRIPYVKNIASDNILYKFADKIIDFQH